jgi:hypothetical protein
MLWKYKKCYQETNEETEIPVAGIYYGLVSDTTDIEDSNSCNNLELNSVVYVQEQNPGFFTIGDIVYTDISATIPLIGNGEYYKIKAINTATRIVTIDSLGTITSITLTCI